MAFKASIIGASLIICVQAHAAGCPQHETKTISATLKNGGAAQFEASSCGNDDGKGTVTIIAKVSGKSQTLKSTYDASAYSLDLNTDIDLNGDGNPDLAVADGKGRDGDGMHYWAFDPKSSAYVDLGEAPALKQSADSSKSLFAVVTSSGDVQATRYDYRLIGNHLKVISAIQFIPTQDTYSVVYLAPQSGDTYKQTSKKDGIKAESAQGCMDGTAACKF